MATTVPSLSRPCKDHIRERKKKKNEAISTISIRLTLVESPTSQKSEDHLVDSAEAAFSDLVRGMEAVGGGFHLLVREYPETKLRRQQPVWFHSHKKRAVNQEPARDREISQETPTRKQKTASFMTKLGEKRRFWELGLLPFPLSSKRAASFGEKQLGNGSANFMLELDGVETERSVTDFREIIQISNLEEKQVCTHL